MAAPTARAALAAEDRRMTQTPQSPQGNTIPVQGEEQERVPRQPHERDESADSQARAEPSQKKMGEAAHRSLERGEVDTDKGPPMEKAYERVKR